MPQPGLGCFKKSGAAELQETQMVRPKTIASEQEKHLRHLQTLDIPGALWVKVVGAMVSCR